jgi:hypothetical protein
MLIPISFNAKSLAKIPVVAASATVPGSMTAAAEKSSTEKSMENSSVPAAMGGAAFQWVSFGADKKAPSEGALATQEFEGAKDQLRAAMKKAGMTLDDANFLILSSGKKLYGIVPKNYSNRDIKAFEKALVEALKELSAETFPRLAQFASENPPAVLIERVKFYRPA